MSNPWFRMYTDFLTDSKMISLAFEDQRHFIGILALKCSGALDQGGTNIMMNRIVSQRLWIDHSLILDVKKRLVDSGLIDESWQPVAWEHRQRKSDFDATGKVRQQRHRARNALCNGTVTPPEQNRTDKNRTEIELPEWFPKSLLEDFKDHRKKLKKPLTVAAEQILINRLLKFKENGFDVTECLETALLNGWLTVYEPKNAAVTQNPLYEDKL